MMPQLAGRLCAGVRPQLMGRGTLARSHPAANRPGSQVDPVGQKGWVARHPDPAHARILQADLTSAGRTVLRACRLAVDAEGGQAVPS